MGFEPVMGLTQTQAQPRVFQSSLEGPVNKRKTSLWHKMHVARRACFLKKRKCSCVIVMLEFDLNEKQRNIVLVFVLAPRQEREDNVLWDQGAYLVSIRVLIWVRVDFRAAWIYKYYLEQSRILGLEVQFPKTRLFFSHNGKDKWKFKAQA